MSSNIDKVVHGRHQQYLHIYTTTSRNRAYSSKRFEFVESRDSTMFICTKAYSFQPIGNNVLLIKRSRVRVKYHKVPENKLL